MKAIIGTLLIITLVFALGIAMTGCSKAATPINTNPAETVADDTGTEFVEANPDLGMLDDSQVSDELPQ